MVIRRCKLCLKYKELRESHLIPAAVYKICRPDKGEITDPIGIRNDPKTKSFRVFQSSRQVTGRVLCFDCEQVLNLNGEDWVLPQLSTLVGFPLHQMLTMVPPDIVDGDIAAYAAARVPAIQVDKLVHFALGIFWKAAVYDWQIGNGTLRLELGPYTDEIRNFLLGGNFPQHVYLMLNVVPPSLPTISAYLPYKGSVEDFSYYSFYVPGIEFMLTVGNRTPQYLRAMCIVSNPGRPILVGAFTAEFIGTKFKEAFDRGHIPSRLAERLKKGR